MSDDQPETTTTMTKVVISTLGISVSVESAESLARVTERAQEIHREAHERCGARLPSGFGGAL